MKYIMLIISLSVALLLTGCPTMQEIRESSQKQEASRHAELVQRGQDPGLASEFYPSPFGPDYQVKVYLDMVVLGQKSQLSGIDLKEIAGKVAGVDLSNDIVAHKYVEVAKKRGNTVKLYKSGLNKLVGNMSGKSDLFITAVERRDLATCLVEFDGSGRIVSVMSRAHAFGNNVYRWRSYEDYEMAYLYFGKAARMIENKIDNRAFEANFIAVL